MLSPVSPTGSHFSDTGLHLRKQSGGEMQQPSPLAVFIRRRPVIFLIGVVTGMLLLALLQIGLSFDVRAVQL
jgi:uncharacterized membrane protein YdfJ with MMPL/SSD domain